jgi:hypothetical protein
MHGDPQATGILSAPNHIWGASQLEVSRRLKEHRTQQLESLLVALSALRQLVEPPAAVHGVQAAHVQYTSHARQAALSAVPLNTSIHATAPPVIWLIHGRSCCSHIPRADHPAGAA